MLRTPQALWRLARSPMAGRPVPERWFVPPLAMLGVLISFVIAFVIGADESPVNVGRDVGNALDNAIDWMTTNVSWIFRTVSDILTWFFVALKDMLIWFPWPAFIVGVVAISLMMVSWRMAAASGGALVLLAVFGLWDSTMETVMLIIVSVTLSILIAVPMGIWASQNDRLDTLLRPLLDAMQTMPSFVYLVPAIAFFGLGNVPGVLASLIFAVPPAIRLTNLGIRQLPAETLESAESFGMTRRQMLLKVKIPLAIPTIMAGVNQTTLMALSMVAIASLVGTRGLGLEVYRGLGRIEPGNAFIAGLGIVFLAIILDRITQAFTRQRQEAVSGESTPGSAYAQTDKDRPGSMQRLQRSLAPVLLATMFWLIVALTIGDEDLSPRAFLGGAKALFVAVAVLTTIWAGFRIGRLGRPAD